MPLHSSIAGRRFGRVARPTDVTDEIAERLIRLPMYALLDGDLDRVIDRVYRAIGKVAA